MPDALRTILKSAVALLVIYAVWQLGPAYYNYRLLRTEIADATRQGGREPEQELRTRVVGLATDRGVPITRDGVKVSKDRIYTRVVATYTEQLRPFPGVVYPWTVSIEAEGLAIKPKTMSDVLSDVLP